MVEIGIPTIKIVFRVLNQINKLLKQKNIKTALPFINALVKSKDINKAERMLLEEYLKGYLIALKKYFEAYERDFPLYFGVIDKSRDGFEIMNTSYDEKSRIFKNYEDYKKAVENLTIEQKTAIKDRMNGKETSESQEIIKHLKNIHVIYDWTKIQLFISKNKKFGFSIEYIENIPGVKNIS